jgi:uncharacterized protein (TIGR02266 family)
MAGGSDKVTGDYVVFRPERRKNLRVDIIVLKVKAEGGSGVFFGYAKNLSTGGLFISTVNPKLVGEEFKISFALPESAKGEEDVVSCRCKVAWTREYDPASKKGEAGMGLRFLDLDHKVRARISDWVKGVGKDKHTKWE